MERKRRAGNVGGERYLARHRTATTTKNLSPLRVSGRKGAVEHLVAKRGGVECSERGVAMGRGLVRLL
jgi:hypothetical protein